MRHPTEGTLRRLVDEPAGVSDSDREHVASCPVCLSGLATARDDARLVGAALGGDAMVDVEAGWQRLSRTASGQVRRPAEAVPTRRWRHALRSPVVAAVGVVAVLAGAGAAAAADWLQVFRTERIAPVTVTEEDLVALPDLSAYGDLEVVDPPRVHQVADAAGATAATGLSVPRVSDLPRGVSDSPRFQVGRQVSAVFTFSAEKATRAAAATDDTLPPPPPGLDGSRFRLVAGPGVAMTWSDSRGVPALLVARAVAPTAYSSGVPFDTARDYLLSLPGLPDHLASQLRGFSADGRSFPLPVPAEKVRTSDTRVGGRPATLLTSRDGLLAAVVWVDDGVVTVVAGSVSADEVLSVARELR